MYNLLKKITLTESCFSVEVSNLGEQPSRILVCAGANANSVICIQKYHSCVGC